MAMPGSGTISFSQLQTEFGGANPISLSEYYRGGSPAGSGTARVPGTRTVTTYPYQWVPQAYLLNYNSVTNNDFGTGWYFNGALIYNGAQSSQQLISGVYYRPGAFQGSTYTAASKYLGAFYSYHYAIDRYQIVSSTTTESVNAGVPASGTISMNQFHGTQDYT